MVMSFGRTKLLLSFAILGYFIGMAAYFVFDWILTNLSIGIQPVPILAIISAPWFISGIAGSFLSIAVLFAFVKFSNEK